jgi:hypothetical protein
MPNYLDLFPNAYRVNNNPLNTLSVDPTKFIQNFPTEAELLAEVVLEAPLEILAGWIETINQALGLNLPDPTTLLHQIQTFLGPLALPFCPAGQGNLLSQLPIVGQLFGGNGIPSSLGGAGLFGSGGILGGAGGILQGFTGELPILAELIGAGGGNSTAPNLVEEFVSIFTGGGGAGWAGLVSGLFGLGGGSQTLFGTLGGNLMTLLGNPNLNPGGTFNPVNLIPFGNIASLSTLFSGFGTSTSILTQLIGVIPGLTGGLTGLTGLGSIFTDLTGLLGAPTALGSGTPVLPGIGSIPVLGGLLSGGNILGSLIPGLDASKIVSGLFPISQITNLSTLLGGFGTSTSILTQLIGVIPGLTGGLTGLTGLGSIFTDLTGLLGAPTALGSGSPVLPGIGSIPVLGGLLSGGNILGSIIPGLDASKIVSGLFPISQITNLSTLLGGFGTSTSIITQLIGVIPGLTGGLTGLTGLGSIFTDLTHILGSPTDLGSGTPVLPGISSIPVLGGLLSGGNILGSIIPGLDASKVTTGTFGTGLIPNITKAMSADLQGVIDGAYQAINGGSSTGNTVASVKTGLLAFPGANIASVLTSSVIPSLDASKVTTGTFAETVTGVNTLRDSFVKGFLNTATTGWTNTDAQNQAATVAQQANAAQVAAAQANATLAAQQAQTNSNNAAGGFYQNITPSGADAAALSATDFASTGPTSGDLCIRGSNGYIGVKAAAATNTAGYYAILNYAFTTDNQVLEVALGDQGSYDSAYTTLYMHCDTAHTVGAYCSIGNGRVVIGSYTRSGGSYTYTPFAGGGNTYTGTLQSGMRVGFRNNGTTWSILVNGNSVLNKVDSTVTFSSARRSAAVSMDRQHSSGFFGWGAADYDSFRIANISMSDYVVPTYIGSGAHIYRSSTSAVTIIKTATSQLLPTSLFDNTEKSTADITVDLTNGKFTVANAGWYGFTFRAALNAPLTSGGGGSSRIQQYWLLYKNGSIHKWGNSYFSVVDSASVTHGVDAVFNSGEVYLAAGDTIQMGYNNGAALHSSSGNFVGDATGGKTHFEISLLNRSTL